MLDDFWHSWAAWWATLTPAFAFLLALPFVVAAVGLAADCVRRGKRPRRSRV